MAHKKEIFSLIIFLLPVFLPDRAFAQRGALAGERYRILVSSDIGGSDEDDDQSLVHLLLYADLFDIEGLVSSPPHAGRAGDFLEVLDVYARDYPRLKRSGPYPSPDRLRQVVKQGAAGPAPPQGFARPTEGSEWIIRAARQPDQRPLYVLVWGSITDVAQALHDAPDIKRNIRVHFIASWNERQDTAAYQYINRHHPDLWMIRDNSTFRGWYLGGNQSGDLGNETFVARHVKRHGALGDYFYPLKKSAIKMGDTPTAARLLWGNPDDPAQESWGGRFVPVAGRPHWWTDDPNPALAEGNHPGAKTVNQWREAYLRNWQQRMERLRSETKGQ